MLCFWYPFQNRVNNVYEQNCRHFYIYCQVVLRLPPLLREVSKGHLHFLLLSLFLPHQVMVLLLYALHGHTKSSVSFLLHPKLFYMLPFYFLWFDFVFSRICCDHILCTSNTFLQLLNHVTLLFIPIRLLISSLLQFWP